MTRTKPAEKIADQEAAQKIANTLTILCDNVEQLLRGPLKRKTLLILLASSSGLSQDAVNRVLTAIQELRKDWLN